MMIVVKDQLARHLESAAQYISAAKTVLNSDDQKIVPLLAVHSQSQKKELKIVRAEYSQARIIIEVE